MVRRYSELVQEIKDRQKFSRLDWTKKVIEALQYTADELERSGNSNERITYVEWKEWQEDMAKKFGFSETTDIPPDYSRRNIKALCKIED